MIQQKQREDWVRSATRAMRDGGVEAIRVEALARALKVTKGSFYWHFNDRPELLAAVLDRWVEETERLIARARAEAEPAARLRAFFELATRAPELEYPNDSAVFAWAERDAGVAARIREVEERRTAFIEEQLRACGLNEAEAELRGQVLYLATLGWIERASRVPRMRTGLLPFAEYVLQLVLPAEAPTDDSPSDGSSLHE